MGVQRLQGEIVLHIFRPDCTIFPRFCTVLGVKKFPRAHLEKIHNDIPIDA